MSRSRHDREYERERERGGRGRDYELDRERDRDRDREKDRDRHRHRERERSRERGAGREERGGSRDRSRRGGSRERNRESDRGLSRDRSRGEKERGSSRDQQQHHHRDRHNEDAKPVKRLRSKSPKPARDVESVRESTRSPRQADAAANEDVPAVTGNQQPSEDDAVSKMEAAKAALEAKEKEKAQPTFEYSGKLAAETNKVRGVTLAFVEPPESRKPTTRWRLYVFKDGEPLNEPLYIHRQTCYLFGRERRVADVPTDHPSCSKQHAVIQYRDEDIP